MQRLNAALAHLASHTKAGFRASSPSSSAASSPSSTSTPSSASRPPSAVRPAPSSASLRAQAAQGQTREKVDAAARDASGALAELRELVRDGTLARKKVEVEKAAGSVVASLVEMELYRPALSELSSMRASLLSWWLPTPPSPPSPSAAPAAHLPSLLVPLPPASFLAPPSLSETLSSASPATPARPGLVEIAPLVLALQQYLLGCLFRLSPSSLDASTRAEGLAALLRAPKEGEGTPAQWRALLEEQAREGTLEGLEGMSGKEREGLMRKLDAMGTSMFGSVAKGCAGADVSVAPETLLTLRHAALLLYLSSSPCSSPSALLPPSSPPAPAPPQEKLDALHDQHRKILLLYGRAAEARGESEAVIGREVRERWEAFGRACRERGVRCEGRKWGEGVEVVMHIARRANDLPFLSRLSSLIDAPPSLPSSDSTPHPPADPEAAATALCSRMLNALAVFEAWAKDASSSTKEKEEDVLSALSAVLSLLPSFTGLRLALLAAPSPSSSSSPEPSIKLDRALDRLRHVLSRHLRAGGRRMEQLVVPAGAAVSSPRWTPVDQKTREVLDRLAGHGARVVAALRAAGSAEEEEGKKAREKAWRDLTTTTVDALLLLAYSSTAVDDRASHAVAFAYLERCLPLVAFPSLSSFPSPADSADLDLDLDLDLAQHYSLRTLTSAAYNLGGTLFNAGLPDAAGRFCALACGVAAAVLGRARAEGVLSDEGEGLVERMRGLEVGDEEGTEREREKETKEAMRDLERLMSRRWELWALAAHAVGDKKTAHAAYVSAILSSPSSLFTALSASAASSPLPALLSTPTSPAAALYKLIQRATRLATFDLLLPSSSIPLTPASDAPLPPAAHGLLLELQLAALAPFADKPDARRATAAILAALEGVYGRAGFPLRRARVALARMQHLTSGGGGGAGAGLAVEAAAKEVDELCSATELGADAALAPFRAGYLALSHLFLAFHAHAASPSPALGSPALPAAVEASELVASEARQALNILRTALERITDGAAAGGGAELPPSPSGPAAATGTRTVSFASPAKASPHKSPVAVTPPARQRTRTRAAPAAAPAAVAPAAPPSTRTRRMTARSAAASAPTAPTARATTARRPAAKVPPVKAVEQVTPPRRTRGAVSLREERDEEGEKEGKEAVRTPVRAGAEKGSAGRDAGKAEMEDVQKVWALFDTMAALLGTLGHQLLKIAFLRFLRRLAALLPSSPTSSSPSPSGSPAPPSGDAFVLSSSALGREYLRLGKTARAGLVFAQAEARITAGERDGAVQVGERARIEYWLRYAEYLAVLGNHDRAAQAYDSALQLAGDLDPEDTSAATTTTAKIVERTLLLQRAGLASSVCSVMLQRKGELSRSLAPAMQAMRLGTRALNNISRLAPAPPKPSASAASDDAAFQVPPTDHVTALADAAPINERKSSTTLPGGAQAGLAWQLAEALLDSTLRVAQLHFTRGTPKSADFYATQALELAEDLGSARMMARALAVRAEVRLCWGKWEEADGDVTSIEKLVGRASCPEATEVHRLRAEMHLRASLDADAVTLCLDAQRSLELFASAAADREAGHSPVKHQTPAKHFSPARARGSYFTHPTPSPSASRNATPLDLVLPAVHATLIRMHIHLIRDEHKQDELQRLLRRLSKLASLEEDKADELKLRAALQIQDLLRRCSSDPVLGMLPDSVLSMPVLGIAASGSVVKVGTPRTGPTVLNSLKEIETLLARAIAFSTSRAQPSKLRELALLSASTRTLQASVGKSAKRSTGIVAQTLDLAAAVTLRREMLDAVEHKLRDRSSHDDLDWPLVSVAPSTDDDSVAQLCAQHDRYRVETAEPVLTDSSLSSILPESWSAISIHLTPEHDSLLLVRHRRESEPVLFKLPLDRLARREGEEDDAFTFEVAIKELSEIVELSNQGTQSAKHVDGKEERAAWWQARKELDKRLQELLQMMEDAWLGAFKSIFYDSRKVASEDFAGFKARFERILKRSMVRAANDKKATRFKLDDAIVECLAALPSSSREEDLEDLFYYAAESFHFGGVPLAHDETDVDQVVVDLREALEELHGTKSAPRRIVDPDEHTFLILDKTLQSFPWESLPCLRGRSVSRLPSLAFLRDRLDLAASRSTLPDQPHDLVINPKSAAYVLNPGGDLKNTQKTFEPWLDERKAELNWTGVVSRTPLEEEMKAGLSQKELFLYFGHGGAEQYIRSQTIRHLPRCAVTMLWGCSSGLLKDQGDFDPVGTPYHYMVGGCPALVANLWDVTDKDIDKFAFSVFRQTGLADPDPEAPPPPSSSSSSSSSSSVSLTAAIARSRDVCNLRYLNGAAPVVYGIPVRFSSSSSS
ncbi:hypothetical protein JCM10207_004847 [Rhodosporidiobolus poonsookiae]